MLISSSLSNVSAILEELTTMGPANNSLLEEVKNVVNSSHLFESISSELKASSLIGLSDELNNAEESLEGLSLLQYSSQPPDEHLTEKLVKTEKALRNLFGKAVTLSPSWVDILWFVVSAVFWSILCVVAIVASTILGIVISWIKEGWEKYEEQKRLGS
uniref:Uncharacterized protein n=1 Tax=Caenorhabditis japonica TaxID=281687 RepID=A0A8R1I2R4_CAEJA